MKTPVLESLFNKIAGIRTALRPEATLSKRDSNTSAFL